MINQPESIGDRNLIRNMPRSEPKGEKENIARPPEDSVSIGKQPDRTSMEDLRKASIEHF
jgi:hypothetical protein